MKLGLALVAMKRWREPRHIICLDVEYSVSDEQGAITQVPKIRVIRNLERVGDPGRWTSLVIQGLGDTQPELPGRKNLVYRETTEAKLPLRVLDKSDLVLAECKHGHLELKQKQ